jgi:hypothetical protein
MRATAAGISIGLFLVAGPARAQFPPITDPNEDEFICQVKAATAMDKLVVFKSKCVQKCISAARRAGGPYDGCFGPAFTDPATNRCINDLRRGVVPVAQREMRNKYCSTDCPECYPAGVCSTGEPFVADTGALVDPYASLVYCIEAQGGTPTREEARCEDAVAKQLNGLRKFKGRCYKRCKVGEWKGKLAPGSCVPPVPSDPDTADCIFNETSGAEAEAAAAIAKACSGTSRPSCYGDSDFFWVELAQTDIDARIPIVYCDEPAISTTTSTVTTSTSTTTLPCTGEPVGGHCWFRGTREQDCNTVCAIQGLVYDPATATYAGSGGTDAQCEAVLAAFGDAPLDYPSATSCATGVGCSKIDFGPSGRCIDLPTTATASAAALLRYCACR